MDEAWEVFEVFCAAHSTPCFWRSVFAVIQVRIAANSRIQLFFTTRPLNNLNHLSIQLQGRCQTVLDLYSHVRLSAQSGTVLRRILTYVSKFDTFSLLWGDAYRCPWMWENSPKEHSWHRNSAAAVQWALPRLSRHAATSCTVHCPALLLGMSCWIGCWCKITQIIHCKHKC